jgi:hypothetical protein
MCYCVTKTASYPQGTVREDTVLGSVTADPVASCVFSWRVQLALCGCRCAISVGPGW